MADLTAASGGLAQLQVRSTALITECPDQPCSVSPRQRSKALSPSPLLQAAFGKGDLEACKQLLSRLKVREALQHSRRDGRCLRRFGHPPCAALHLPPHECCPCSWS